MVNGENDFDDLDQQLVDQKTAALKRRQGLRQGFLGRAKSKLQAFREKQVEFGDIARERKLGREESRLKIQKVREERLLSKARVSAAREKVSRSRADTSIVSARASRIRGPGSSLLGGFSQSGAREALGMNLEGPKAPRRKKGSRKGKKRKRTSQQGLEMGGGRGSGGFDFF